MPLDDLDREKLGPLSVSVGDRRAELRPATSMAWQEVAACIHKVEAFIALVLPQDVAISSKGIERLHALWIGHNGLTGSDNATRRLARALDKFNPALEADFARYYPSANVGELWRGRQWRYLLNLIDRLPQNSYYHHELMQDEEHAAAVAEWKAKKQKEDGEEEDKAPPWSVWSPEVEVLTRIEDQIKVVAHRVIAAQGGKAPDPKFAPRPKSAIERAVMRKRWEAHESLADRLLRRNRST